MRYVLLDHEARLARFEQRTEAMTRAVATIPGVSARSVPASPGHYRPASIPRVEVDVSGTGLGSGEVLKRLREGNPSIRLYELKNKVYISPQCLSEEEDAVVVERLRSALLGNNAAT
jgi:hypothetical protein